MNKKRRPSARISRRRAGARSSQINIIGKPAEVALSAPPQGGEFLRTARARSEAHAPAPAPELRAPDDLLTPEQAAQYLHRTPATLANWRSNGRYRLSFVKCGSRILYRRSAIEAFLNERTRGAGAAA